MGASLAWVGPAHGSRVKWREGRDLYSQGGAAKNPTAGQSAYRTLHTAKLWKNGERPQLKTSVLEGDPELSA